MPALQAAVGVPSFVTEKLPDPSQRVGFSSETIGGRVVFDDVIKKYYEETNNKSFPSQPPV